MCLLTRRMMIGDLGDHRPDHSPVRGLSFCFLPGPSRSLSPGTSLFMREGAPVVRDTERPKFSSLPVSAGPSRVHQCNFRATPTRVGPALAPSRRSARILDRAEAVAEPDRRVGRGSIYRGEAHSTDPGD